MTYLQDKHSRFLASLEKPPVMPICHGPSDLLALAEHLEAVNEAYIEYLSNIANVARSLNVPLVRAENGNPEVPIKPEQLADDVRTTIEETCLAHAIRVSAKAMPARVKEWA